MKKVWLSAMAVAAALAFVAVPSAVNPAPAHAQMLPHTDTLSYMTSFTGNVGYTYNYFAYSVPLDGGSVKFHVARNDGGGQIWGRIINTASPYTIYGNVGANSNGDIVFSGFPAGNYDIEFKTLSTPGYMVVDLYD